MPLYLAWKTTPAQKKHNVASEREMPDPYPSRPLASSNRSSNHCPDQILIGIHGVGSPHPGVVSHEIWHGYANSRYDSELWTDMSAVPIALDTKHHRYEGIRVRDRNTTIEIWEVNWSDLKGLPRGAIGTIFYALKTLIAMVEISSAGWDPYSTGAMGPLFFGFLFRIYFFTFALVAPPSFILIIYAYVQCQATVACLIIVSITILLALVIWRLQTADRLILYSLIPVTIGACTAALELSFPQRGNFLIRASVEAITYVEATLGLIIICALAELLIRCMLPCAKGSKRRQQWSIFASRSGMMVLATAIGAGAYGAIVNAIGLFVLNQFLGWRLIDEHAWEKFQNLYLDHLGYNLAQMEMVNGGTTFVVGSLLVLGVSYHLIRISGAGSTSMVPRGRYIQNWINIFLWSLLAGSLFVSIAFMADLSGFFSSSDPECPRNVVCSLYGIQWLFASKQTQHLSPLEIYGASATRILPFLLPALVPPLRIGLNVVADVVLYILPDRFSLSLSKEAQARFQLLLDHLWVEYPKSYISVLSHSQGTVIALDVLGKDDRKVNRFVTTGSPIGSLYGRFLGGTVRDRAGCEWINIYRLSDYVAGPIASECVSNEVLQTNYPFGHFRYFEDTKVVERATERGGRQLGVQTGPQEADVTTHFGQWMKNNSAEGELQTFIKQSADWPASGDGLNEYVDFIQTANPANKDQLLIALGRNFERWSQRESIRDGNFGEKYGTLLLAAFGLIIAIVLVLGLFFRENFFRSIAEAGQARGLITFLFAFATISIILLITIATFWMEKDEVEARFTKAKDLVAILIGVLGTILGFYFGSAGGAATAGRLTVSNLALSAYTAKAGDKVRLFGSVQGGSSPYQYEIKANDPTGAIKVDIRDRKSDTGSIAEEISIPADLSRAATVNFTVSAKDARGAAAEATSSALAVQPK